MTLELMGYLGVCLVALTSTLMPKNILTVSFAFIAVVVYMGIVRHSGWDYDMHLYASMLHANFDFSMENMYYMREFVFWYGMPAIFNIVDDEIWTFIVVDIIWVFFVFYSVLNKKNERSIPLFCAPFMICFFPLLMGYENIYRQFLASMVVMFAFYGFKNKYIIYALGLVALFVHNSAIIYLPLLYLYSARKSSTRKKLNPIQLAIFSMTFLVMIGGVYYSSLGDSELAKSSNSTGISLGPAYAALFTLFFILAVFMAKFNLKKLVADYAYILYAFFSFLIIFPVLGGAQGERVGMMLLIIIVPMFLADFDRLFKDAALRWISRLVFVMLGIAPTFLFSSAFNFLLTGS
ncbi:EpsG family protein [Larsenimonas suaedae]|uniref:EpsG family protein n=1 Tax=Larsenimonas suaedae TaxID=1851019 RepID=A0ABU1GXM8_9GAMM|nr:EpsG family protein [Larsenimonas suaedae]MCM2971556.1 EpsG family protein [Larsenimonas suaedae]MDR5896812.1 EpsG family protein [Larsenimonas suaedae]